LLFLCILLSPQGQEKYGLVAHTDVLHLATWKWLSWKCPE
jgi:hypothetical protein